MDNEPYSVDDLREALADAMDGYNHYGVIVINNEYHEDIILDVLNAEIKRLETKSRKKRNKKSGQSFAHEK